MRIEPFTYYRSADNLRAFLVVNVSDPEQHKNVPPGGEVVLIEWGKTRHDPIRHQLKIFHALVDGGSLIAFTPNMKNA